MLKARPRLGRSNSRRWFGLSWLFAAALFFVFANSILPAVAAERRVALVIGNGAYDQTPLLNTINDARAMTDVLGRLGFKVITKLNVTQREMLYAIVEFGRELEKGGVGLFYYAGHAVQIHGRNFLIPVGARISVEDHVEPESVNINRVVARMSGARNRLNIVILDACRDNPFGDTFDFYSEGLAQTRAPAGSYVAYAAAPGELAADGSGTNSFYTAALVKALGIQGLPIEEVFKRVRSSVITETRGHQVPWTSSSITEDFYFNPSPPTVAEEKNEAIGRAVDLEVVFWQSIINSERAADFEAYLNQFPDGNFATLARNNLAALKRKEPAQQSEAAVEDAHKGLDRALIGAVDRAISGARESGANYTEQIQAAVRRLTELRRQREEEERAAEEARKRVIALVRQKAAKAYEGEMAKGQLAATRAEKARLEEAGQKAERDRKEGLEASRKRVLAELAAAQAIARQQVDQRANQSLEKAKKDAAAWQKREIAQASDQAAEAFDRSMADAEKAAKLLRQRMIEVARDKAEKRRQQALSEAKRAADEKAATIIAKAKEEAETARSRELAAVEQRFKTIEARRIEEAQEEATKAYDAAMAKAKAAAKAERERVLAEAKRAAEASRQEELAALEQHAPKSTTGKEDAPSYADVPGLGDIVSPALKGRVDKALAGARAEGKDRVGQMRAAIEAIKASKETEAGKAASTLVMKEPQVAPSALSVATPELKEIIEMSMQRARAEGKSYQGQVLAALNAVKAYRERETKAEKSGGSHDSQTSDLLLGQAEADPRLRQIISAAMSQARAKGESYAGQVRAALDAIKAHRAKTADTTGR